MYKYSFLIFFLISFSQAQDKVIDCSDGVCSPNFIPEDQSEKSFFSFLDLGKENNEDISVLVQPNQNPRSLRMYLENNTLYNDVDVSVNLSPTVEEFDAADFMIIGDIFDNMSINLDGYQGQEGKDASRICADNYLLGENDGGYGEIALNNFLSRRSENSSAPANRCEFSDVDYLQQNNFSCSRSNYEEIDRSNPEVEVERLRGKSRCLGLSFHDVCLSRTVEVECNWKVKYLEPEAVAGQFSNDPADSETKTFRIAENEWLEKKERPGFPDYLCNVATKGDSEEDSRGEILKNPTLSFNPNDWTLTNSEWTNRKIKTKGFLGQDVRPKVQQVINTEPGRKYRVRGTWSKALEDSWISTGRIQAFKNTSRNEVLGMDEFYEQDNLIGDIHFNSSPTYHHFRYIKVDNETKEQEFIITNDDDRVAKNCEPPYLTGDITQFSIISDSCGSNDLGIGESCSVNIRSDPTSLGRKSVFLKRKCEDKYGDKTSLNTKIEAQGYRDYPISQSTMDECEDEDVNEYDRSYVMNCRDIGYIGYNGQSWTLNRSTEQWTTFYARWNYIQTKTYYSLRTMGQGPSEMDIGNVPNPPPRNIYPLPDNDDVLSENKKDRADLDFVFTAQEDQTLIEYSPILRFHSGYINEMSVTEVSPNAGPSIPPVTDSEGNYLANVAGAEGNGYYELAGEPNFDVTQPGFDPVFFRVPEESDWDIRYVGIGQQCPNNFEKIKNNHLASIIAFDDNDDLCDDVSAPEDPSGLTINWRTIGFDRLPEFGTETVRCSIDDCPLTSQVTDINHNLDELNPTLGIEGTNQGGGALFVYDADDVSVSAQKGSRGIPGRNDIPLIQGERICARIQDVQTEGEGSRFAADPVVNFERYNWQALKVVEPRDIQEETEDNNKKVKVFKKMDSSARFLLKREIL